MKIVVTMPVRNEDWVLGLSARAVLQWADELVILDHASDEMSPEIEMDVAEEFPSRVTVIHELNTRWEEMRHRQRLLELARERKATHIAIVDADEVLTANLLPCIRGLFESTPVNSVLQIPWLALRGSIGQVHTTGPWATGQNVSMGFQDAPQLHWSSEKRGGYDFHHRHPMGRPCVPYMPLASQNPLAPQRREAGLMHLQFVSERRLRAKQALYKIQEVIRWPGREPVAVVDQRYSLAVYGMNSAHAGWEYKLDGTMAPAPMAEWWDAYAGLLKYLRVYAVPWQETEVLRLIKAHGPDKFQGLDLFGLSAS